MASSNKLFINRVAQEEDTSRIPVASNQVVSQNISSGQDTSEKTACSDQSDGDESIQSTSCEAVPQTPHRKRYSLRDRDNSAKFLFRYLNEDNSSSSSKITVPIYPEDIFTVELCQPFTAPVIDYVIYKRIARGKRSVYSFGTSLFGQIEHADQTQKSFSAANDLVDKMQWDFYPFVLIPVSGRNHWSLLVVEHSLLDRVKCYHVDSVAGMHQSEYIFDIGKVGF
ncbi:hypothetical protein PHMEG_00016807 [Phytophthora megakarya]|uniref:Ubiquitin-like protease family profile domain-containing protein n=1 Tax=Phytophthora megakarya TaxID=4795 RepID=A0A225VYC1_9STRA|nr:hypothetical protein PHMEG_00016807 [Phytophthora megakarya]